MNTKDSPTKQVRQDAILSVLSIIFTSVFVLARVVSRLVRLNITKLRFLKYQLREYRSEEGFCAILFF